MPRKLRDCICSVCGTEFKSASPGARLCSVNCRTRNKGLSIWEKVQSNCIVCNKEYTTKKSENGKLQSQFCSKSCQSKYIFKNSGNGMCGEVKKKISDKLIGISLRERGYTKESISAWVQAGQEASIKMCKGKTLEEIVGDEKAAEIRIKHSENRTGDNNPQSLDSISKRFNCSLDEARKLTTCYNRIGDKHPMFSRILLEEEKRKCVPHEIKETNTPAVIVGTFNNIRWQGSWELEFLINCYEEGINVKRYDLSPIDYFFEGYIHKTWPDFITEETSIIEVKGYCNEKSKARIEACQQYFGDDFIVIDSVKKRKEISSLQWINKQIEKYGDLIKIINIPKNIKQETITNE